jgi:hypothetical protein
MRNGTKFGLILIVVLAFAASTAISMLALKAALRPNGEPHETGEPMRHVVPSAFRVSADI